MADPEIGRTVDAGGIATNLHDRGGGPPVLLLHGSGPGVTAWANWRTVLPRLEDRFRVVAPDIVGFGYTERPTDAAYAMPYWRDHAVAVLDALGIESCGIVGNSFGGGLALALAAAHPERVDRLVLMGSAGYQRHVEAMAQSEETLRALDRETLIVHGRDDRIIPLDSSIALHRLIPRSQLHVFGRCGHWTQIEQNARFCRLIADFFSE